MEEFLVSIQNKLAIYALHLTKNKVKADDLVSDTNVKILININSFRNDNPTENEFMSWSCAVMRNMFFDNQRKIKGKEHTGQEHANNIFEEKALSLYTKHNDREINDHLIKMMSNSIRHIHNDDMRIALIMRKMGYKYEQIANYLDINKNSVKSMIFRGKQIILNDIKHKVEKYLSNI